MVCGSDDGLWRRWFAVVVLVATATVLDGDGGDGSVVMDATTAILWVMFAMTMVLDGDGGDVCNGGDGSV